MAELIFPASRVGSEDFVGARTPFTAPQLDTVRRILARTPHYIDDNTRLRVTLMATTVNATVVVDVRRSTFEGELVPNEYAVDSGGAYTLTSREFPLARGLLHQCVARLRTAPSPTNYVFVIVELVQGSGAVAFPLGGLVQGYITQSEVLFWPGTPARSSIDGQGIVRDFNFPNPALGAELSVNPNPNSRMQIDQFVATLTTSAAVANRNAYFIVRNGVANPTYQGGSPTTQTAGLLFRYTLYPGANGLAAAGGALISIPLPPYCTLQGEFAALVSVTLGLQAGDQWGDIHAKVREWLVIP